MKKLFVIAVSFLALFTSCDLLLPKEAGGNADNPVPLDFLVNMVKTTYGYDEEITVSLDVTSEANADVSVAWAISPDPGIDLSTFEDDLNLVLSLKPDLTTTYTVTVTVSSGSETKTLTKDFIVKQFPFIGTWRATNVSTPTGGFVDIVGIWYMNGFEMYYLAPNGGTSILMHSARGTMAFPRENEWIRLVETQYWDGDSWEPWTFTDGIMYAKYSYSDDVKLHMTVLLDMQPPGDTAEYTWNFVKVDDSVDPWF